MTLTASGWQRLVKILTYMSGGYLKSRANCSPSSNGNPHSTSDCKKTTVTDVCGSVGQVEECVGGVECADE